MVAHRGAAPRLASRESARAKGKRVHFSRGVIPLDCRSCLVGVGTNETSCLGAVRPRPRANSAQSMSARCGGYLLECISFFDLYIDLIGNDILNGPPTVCTLMLTFVVCTDCVYLYVNLC